MSRASSRYDGVAILLHWGIAIAIIASFGLGWWMHEAFEETGANARVIAVFQIHKSLGLSILALSLLRLVWRLLHRPPAPPPMPAWQRQAAQAVHWLLYGLMLAVPLSGWFYVSTQWRGSEPLNIPTLWFGQFEVPHLFGLNQALDARRQQLSGWGLTAHAWLAWTTAGLLLLHVAAALKHHWWNRDDTLTRMLPRWPLVRRRQLIRLAGVTALLGGLVLAWTLLLSPDPAAPRSIGSLPESDWQVLPDSEIVFAGEHAGQAFRGRFTRWRAGLQFDPAAPQQARIRADIETASARDGDRLHEETLPQQEWFDSARYPLARFDSESVAALGSGRFAVHGRLRIKDRDLAVGPLIITLQEDRLSLRGALTLSRREANLGMDSDPDGQYVSDAIAVEVQLQAQPARP